MRELALRFLADETEEELLEHLRRHEAEVVWETSERIMVAVTAAPGTDALLRRAARMAAEAQGRTRRRPRGSQRRDPPGDRRALEKLRAARRRRRRPLARVRTATIPPGPSPRFAQEHQITQIVIGSSQRSRWQELTGGGSIVPRVIREAGALGIDVHVIALRKPDAPPPAERPAERPAVPSD